MADVLKRAKNASTQAVAEIIPDPQVRANRRNVAMERQDIEWYVENGVMQLRWRETRNDVLFKRMRRREITQDQIDRLPEFIKRIAWNQCLLNYDYEGRYYLPKAPAHAWTPEDDVVIDDLCKPEDARRIMKEFGIKQLAGFEI